jgi:hypothetical protein
MAIHRILFQQCKPTAAWMPPAVDLAPITETNTTKVVLFGMPNRTLGPYLGAIQNVTLISEMDRCFPPLMGIAHLPLHSSCSIRLPCRLLSLLPQAPPRLKNSTFVLQWLKGFRVELLPNPVSRTSVSLRPHKDRGAAVGQRGVALYAQ